MWRITRSGANRRPRISAAAAGEGAVHSAADAASPQTESRTIERAPVGRTSPASRPDQGGPHTGWGRTPASVRAASAASRSTGVELAISRRRLHSIAPRPCTTGRATALAMCSGQPLSRGAEANAAAVGAGADGAGIARAALAAVRTAPSPTRIKSTRRTASKSERTTSAMLRPPTPVRAARWRRSSAHMRARSESRAAHRSTKWSTSSSSPEGHRGHFVEDRSQTPVVA